MYMAMPSGNAVISDKLQFPRAAADGGLTGGGGGEMMALPYQQHYRQWCPDERDGFISWLRGEFAAANAIIDSLCHHLRSVGEPGEYDGVIGSIQQRRSVWNPVLHMQQYFSVAEVYYALQQITWKRQNQHRRFYDSYSSVKRSSGFGSRHSQRSSGESYGKNQSAFSSVYVADGDAEGGGVDVSKSEDKDALTHAMKDENGVNSIPQLDDSCKSQENARTLPCDDSECDPEEVDDVHSPNLKGCPNEHGEDDSSSIRIADQKHNVSVAAKTFVGTEILDGKAVNVVDGMKMYEELVDVSEVRKLVSLVNDLRTAGRRGQFQGQTFVVMKRPMKGHGREMFQFGIPIADAPSEDETTSGSIKDPRIEPIPSLLQDIIDRLMAMKIVPVKPDSCIIDIYNEGDHSQPHMWPYWFLRPVCVLFLTQCEMTFGREIKAEHPGDYRGSVKLSLTPGSMLVMQGRSADFAMHAIPSIRKQRILVTLTKSQPKKPADQRQRVPSAASGPPTSHRVPLPKNSPNHQIRHYPPAAGPKHYVPIPATGGVLPTPAVRPNAIQPIFLPAPVAPPLAFPAPALAFPAPAPPLRHTPPRIPVPGTGVFLPPGSGSISISGNSCTHSPSSPIVAASETVPSGPPSISEDENGTMMKAEEGNATTADDYKDGKLASRGCNGDLGGHKTGVEVDQQQNEDCKCG